MIVQRIDTPPEDADLAGWLGPGWYFYDEGYVLWGPYATAEKARLILRAYARDLARCE